MNIVIAMDSWKGSLSSIEAATSVSEGIRDVIPDAAIQIVPLADGGEGTVKAVLAATGGNLQTVHVKDPLGRQIQASYGILPSGTAVIEMAAASGLTLLSEKERNPFYTSTYGTGQLILDAIQKGCRDFIIGIGGSATNDGGAGMLQALGFSLLDTSGTHVIPGAIGLGSLAEIQTAQAEPLLTQCRFRIACDVTNPLCGTNGSSAVFGPQKGASPEQIIKMDMWLEHYARLAHNINPVINANTPGAGAAGGLGFAFLAFLNASLESGISLIMNTVNLEDTICTADWVITGEGQLDAQSAMGKTPAGVAFLAKKHNVPVIALAGSITEDASLCNSYGIDAFFPVLETPCSLREAMDPQTAQQNIRRTASQIFRLIKTVQTK
ncbi:MAG: glycerate kinase [Peptococcaceae bacterium]|nr:glycerate kinase [Peptococcaceae bacterium]